MKKIVYAIFFLICIISCEEQNAYRLDRQGTIVES